MIQILVDNEKIKQEIIEESKYIHDFIRGVLNRELCNTLSHIYTNPDLFVINIKEVDLSDRVPPFTEEFTEEEIRDFDERYSEILKSKGPNELKLSCFGNISKKLDYLINELEFEKPVVDIGVIKSRNKDDK